MSDVTEIHMFSAVARATDAAAGRRAGDHHPLLIFLRQAPDEAHDLAAAAQAAEALGWDEVDITRAGTLPPDAADSMQDPVLGAYRAAVASGTGVVVFDATVRPAPRKA